MRALYDGTLTKNLKAAISSFFIAKTHQLHRVDDLSTPHAEVLKAYQELLHHMEIATQYPPITLYPHRFSLYTPLLCQGGAVWPTRRAQPKVQMK